MIHMQIKSFGKADAEPLEIISVGGLLTYVHLSRLGLVLLQSGRISFDDLADRVAGRAVRMSA